MTTPLHPAAAVQTGLDTLERSGFAILKGKRVALVTNRSAVNGRGTGIVELFAGNGINVVKVFTPEHGFTAREDTTVADGKLGDVPLISLYGKTKKLNPADLSDVDVCIYDIQSVGARYYTYIATMVYAMQACAATETAMIVCDRPNPSGGNIVSGFMPEKGLTGHFTSMYPIPIRHGMTMGELAAMFNSEYSLGCRLTVIRMKGWNRSMIFSETGLPWINPSPNIQREEAAILYTGIGWLETTSLSMARGTPHAFERLGAPYIDGRKLASAVGSVNGFVIRPVRFVPRAKYHKFYGKECYGIEIMMKNKRYADAFSLSLRIYCALSRLYPEEFKDHGGLPVSCGRRSLRTLLAKRGTDAVWQDSWKEIQLFKHIRRKYLFY